MTKRPGNFFQEIQKSELWYGLLPELLHTEQKWLAINGHIVLNSLNESQRPILATAITMWEQALLVATEGYGYLAAHTLRSVVERAAFLWATSGDIAYNPESIISAYESDNKKLRRRTTDDIIEAACKKDPAIGIIYNEMLSRYFNHLSHLDGISIDESKKNQNKLNAGANILPLLLLFDVGNCLVTVIENILSENKIITKPFIGGRTGHEFKAVDYIRVATYVMCEKHSRKKALPLATLFKNIDNIEGKVGLTDIYRGGMEVYRYGSPAEKPVLDKIKGFSLFAVGKVDPKRVVVTLKEVTTKGERYELRWPKEWDLTFVAVGMVAKSPRHTCEIFDYVSEFIKAIK